MSDAMTDHERAMAIVDKCHHCTLPPASMPSGACSSCVAQVIRDAVAAEREKWALAMANMSNTLMEAVDAIDDTTKALYSGEAPPEPKPGCDQEGGEA